MKTIGTIALVLTAAFALSACDPYTSENTGQGNILSVFTSSQTIAAVDGTKAANGAWTVAGAEDDAASWPVVWVRFDKLLDGFSIQATASGCAPATALNLNVTESTANYVVDCPPVPPSTIRLPATWYACYVPNTSTSAEGAGVVFYQGCEDIASTGSGWNDLSQMHYGGRYHITANVKDKQARSYPIDVTVTTLPEIPVSTASASTPTSATLDFEPQDSTAFQGTATFKVERADNVVTGTPPVDGPGNTWTTLAAAVPAAPPTFTDSTTVSGTKYWYRTTANGKNTLTRLGPVESNIPDKPVVTFANVTATAIQVKWTDIVLAVNYLVQRAPNVPTGTPAVDAPGTFATLATVPAGTLLFDDSGLTANTKYWYRVTAIGGNTLTGVSAATIRSTTP